MSGGEWTQDATGLNVMPGENGTPKPKQMTINDLMGMYGAGQQVFGKTQPQMPQMIPQIPTLQPPASMMEILKKYGRK